MIKYYVWKGNDHICCDGFFDYNDALQFAIDNDADEIEETTWYSEESYENREPADAFRVVWKRS